MNDTTTHESKCSDCRFLPPISVRANKIAASRGITRNRKIQMHFGSPCSPLLYTDLADNGSDGFPAIPCRSGIPDGDAVPSDLFLLPAPFTRASFTAATASRGGLVIVTDVNKTSLP